MRKTRWLLAGLMCAALVPAVASAQRTREFEDSWFWGVKAGVSTFAPTFGDMESSASYGADWLITRRRGALYVALDESRVSTTSAVFDPAFDGEFRPVGVEKLRRLSVAALAFPISIGRFRPYAGLGLAVSAIADAYPLAGPEELEVDEVVWDRVDERKSQANILLMGGAQMQVRKFALFAQASMVPSNDRFLLNDSALGFFEAGVRYNFSGSREGLR
ncbi:MAG: hypothetical protein M3R07_09815 [Gemmatimonadota bacterium]|nr:hypothetical protein [Gemmatimonadota bacterium]